MSSEMKPLSRRLSGASRDWTWHPYDNSTVEVEGRRLASVPGGTHWGGGMRIHAEDQALIVGFVVNKFRGDLDLLLVFAA